MNENEEFRVLPLNYDYAINKDGVVLSRRKRGMKIRLKKDVDGVVTCVLTDNYGRRTVHQVIDLIKNAFPEDVED